MDYTYQDSFQLRDFIVNNKQTFENCLLDEAETVRDKIEEILQIGNIDLVNNAHKLIVFIIDQEKRKIEKFAEQEGIAWATHSIALTFKLEWIQAIRRTLWIFIREYSNLTDKMSIDDLFHLENDINSGVDDFLNQFFINYSTFKDRLIKQQRKLVENLSVPIIPINQSISILPLIGEIDEQRVEILKEKALNEVGENHIQKLMMDVSGVADMEDDVISQLLKLIDSTSMMGCETIITGLRKEVVLKITDLGIKLNEQTRTFVTLQHALSEFLIH
ncbi:STAS domain-containing protein [Aquibacillus kalidii]|uniref:STAS domain-containing protein n=1 Tax=Aquibacillus kalidii TaxID=2762597 RepID=UPI0016466389|nr:STAS domain-containing protein [Aquibacillus kalidii]